VRCRKLIAARASSAVRHELRVRVEKLVHGRTFRQLAEHQFDREPGPANHRLAEHDGRVDLNTSSQGSHTRGVDWSNAARGQFAAAS
jgi:hypothetical protein